MSSARKIAIVTGASSGIGRAVARALARRGYDLALASRRTEPLEAAAAECRAGGVRAVAIPTDVSQREECERLIERAERELGPVDVLVNNAGFAIFDPIEHARPDELQSMMETNYFGTVWCTQAILSAMLSRGRGTIVNIASIAGIMGYAGMGGYCASKFAIIGFSEALRDEVLGRGVRVALVCPGTTDTEFFVKAERGKMPAASRLILAVSPDRVAKAVVAAAEDGKYRRIVPWAAGAYMRFKELMPRAAHFFMRVASRGIDRKKGNS